MSLKYCFQNEIHKTFDFPPDFPSLIEEIRSLFVQKLPSQFIIQYQDADGDHIIISTNQEYLMMIAHELPSQSSSIKIFIAPVDSLPALGKKSTCTPRSSFSNGSFEVVDDENSLKVEEVIDDLSLDNDSKNNSVSKVVVSLAIPQEIPTSEANILWKPIESEQEDESFSCSENKEPKEDLSGELTTHKNPRIKPDGLVISKDLSPSSNIFFNQAFQTEEDDFSFSNGSFRKEANSDGEFEDRRTITLRVPEHNEKDSKDLSDYLRRTAKPNSVDQSFEKPVQKRQDSLTSMSEGRRQKEETQEKWVSFSTEQEDAIAGHYFQSIELQSRNLFNSKQRQEGLFTTYLQEPSYRYQRALSQEDNEKDENLLNLRPLKNSFNAGDLEDFPMDEGEVPESSIDFKVEEEREMSIDFKEPSFNQERNSRNCQYSFEEERQDESNKSLPGKDIWYDAYQSNWDKPASSASHLESDSQISKASDFQMNSSNNLSYNLDDYLRGSDKNNEINNQENVENMNISLLSMSEAKYMASAIGSIHKIRGFQQKYNNRELPVRKEPAIKNRIISPSYNRWISRNYEIRVKEDKTNSSLQRDERLNENNKWTAKNKEEPQIGFKTMSIEKSDENTNPNTHSDRCKIQSPQYRADAAQLEILVSNMCLDASPKNQKSEKENDTEDDLSIPDEQKSKWNFRDFYDSGVSLGKLITLDAFHDMEEPPVAYKFEYKELHNTPLSIRPGAQEWCVVFKTISLKNTGNIMWTRCQLSPVGLESGSKSEVTYVAPGDSVYVTLEIFGFYKPGRYNSTWKVTHRGEMEPPVDLGYIDLEFEIFEKRSFADEYNIYKTIRDEGFHDESDEFNLY